MSTPPKIHTSKRRLVLKIPAFQGKDARTNTLIIERLALDGPQTVYGLNKILKRSRGEYPTIFRAVRRLEKRGYLTRTEPVKMAKRRGRTPAYGLTGRGILASMIIDNLPASALDILERNKHLVLPVERDAFFELARAFWSEEQLGQITQKLSSTFIETLPGDIESLDNNDLAGLFFPSLFSAFPYAEKVKIQTPTELARYPKIVKWFEEQIDHEISSFENTLSKLRSAKMWLSKLESKGTSSS